MTEEKQTKHGEGANNRVIAEQLKHNTPRATTARAIMPILVTICTRYTSTRTNRWGSPSLLFLKIIISDRIYPWPEESDGPYCIF